MNSSTEHGMNIVRAGEILLHFLFPVSCRVCGKIGVSLCPECKDELPDDYFPDEIASDIPERALPTLFEGEIITREINGLTVYSAAHYHDDKVKRVIHRFKYDGARELCRPIGVHMAKMFGKCKADWLIPVPLHLFSERGYNQSKELALGMGDFWGVGVIDAALWTREVPRRATSKIRDDITYEDFRLTQDIYGKRIAIVDDVCTSGMTLSCFAETCRRDGAEVVCAYTLASV